jgi:glycosyltransferase involved in cell wall biosynthesis
MYLFDAFKAEGYSNLIHIPNSIELEKYPFLQRDELAPKMLWVRSFSKIYNPTMALEVLTILLQAGFDASLCMVGPEKDSSLEECQQFAQERDLPVTFTGGLKKEDWIDLSKAYSVFINTTHIDNTPVSVIEAMALGFPVVSTNVGGLPYMIENTKDGILVSPNDPDQFANAIIDILKNPTKGSNLSRNARIKAANFDWQKVKHTWITLLNH